MLRVPSSDAIDHECADMEANIRERLATIGPLTLDNVVTVFAECVAGFVIAARQLNAQVDLQAAQIERLRQGGLYLAAVADDHEDRLEEIERDLDEDVLVIDITPNYNH